MINSQNKGKKAERDVAKEINKYLGTNVRRTPQSGGMSIKGDIIDINPNSAAFDYHFEVKNQKNLSIKKWWEQIYSDCPPGKTPVNVFKMNAKFYVTLELKDWLSSLAELQELRHQIRLELESQEILKEELEILKNKRSK
jgi:hypothetical protein